MKRGTEMLISIEQMISMVSGLDGDSDVCFPKHSPISGGDKCLIVDIRDLGDDEDLSPEAIRLGLTRTLDAWSVASILRNLDQQVKAASLELQAAAIEYYLDNDSFIEVYE